MLTLWALINFVRIRNFFDFHGFSLVHCVPRFWSILIDVCIFFIDVHCASLKLIVFHLGLCLHIFIDVHCFSLELIVFHLGLNGKSKIWTRIYRVNENLDKSFVFQRKLQDFNDNLWKSSVFKIISKIWTRIFRNSLNFQRKIDKGEGPKRKSTQTEESQVR